MTNNSEDFLTHHGVPGMKWGKRKSGTKLNAVQRRNRRDNILMRNVGLTALALVGNRLASNIPSARVRLGVRASTTVLATGTLVSTLMLSHENQKG